MKFLKRNRKAISFAAHFVFYGTLWYLHKESDFQQAAFTGLMFVNLLNYFAGVSNHDLYERQKKYGLEKAQLLDYVIDENKKAKDINDRLHEVNVELRTQVARLNSPRRI